MTHLTVGPPTNMEIPWRIQVLFFPPLYVEFPMCIICYENDKLEKCVLEYFLIPFTRRATTCLNIYIKASVFYTDLERPLSAS
jgi:hypothetical protein